jgi:hypothetical protein
LKTETKARSAVSKEKFGDTKGAISEVVNERTDNTMVK